MFVTAGGAKRHLRVIRPIPSETSKRFNNCVDVRPLRGRNEACAYVPQVSLRSTRRLDGVGRFHRPFPCVNSYYVAYKERPPIIVCRMIY